VDGRDEPDHDDSDQKIGHVAPAESDETKKGAAFAAPFVLMRP
jgi:hypothetical protein